VLTIAAQVLSFGFLWRGLFHEGFALVGVITNKTGVLTADSLPKCRLASSRHKHHRFVGDNTNKGEVFLPAAFRGRMKYHSR
jgi:hypothetical protein